MMGGNTNWRDSSISGTHNIHEMLQLVGYNVI